MSKRSESRAQDTAMANELKAHHAVMINDLDQTECWLQIQYAYPAAQFHDATTWTAVLSGNPVRLTK